MIDKTHHVVEDKNFDEALRKVETPVDATIITNEEDKDNFIASLIPDYSIIDISDSNIDSLKPLAEESLKDTASNRPITYE
jgi:hypothetical protein